MKNSDAEIDIEARSLVDLVERVNQIAVLADEEKRAGFIEGLAKQIYTKFKVSIGLEKEEKKEPEKPDSFAMKMLKKIAKKIFNTKTPEEEAKEAAEYEKTKEIEARIFVAVSKLRSNSSVDSDQNDLNILQDMVKVVEIASDTQVPAYIAEQARVEIGKISSISGTSTDAVRGAKDEQQLLNDSQSLAETLRQNLEGNTSEVSYRPLTTSKEHEKERDAAWAKSSDELRRKENA